MSHFIEDKNDCVQDCYFGGKKIKQVYRVYCAQQQQFACSKFGEYY